MPECKSLTKSAINIPAAAFKRTTSVRGPASPANTDRTMSAFSAAVPPQMSCKGTRLKPKSSGEMFSRVIVPFWIIANCDGPAIEISSNPSRPWTTTECSDPSLTNVVAISSTRSGLATPKTCLWAPAGFVSGPSRLNTVGIPISRRNRAANLIAG